MGTSIQILLPLLSLAVVESRVILNTPLFGMDVGAPPSNGNINDPSIKRQSEDSSYSHSWVQHYTEPQRRFDFMNNNLYPYNRHHKRRPYDQYNSFLDPYFNLDNMGLGNPGFGSMPQIQNIFSLPGQNYDSQEDRFDERNHPEEKPGNHGQVNSHDRIPVGKPKERPQERPQERPEVRPEVRPDVRPENRPEVKPEVRPEERPEERENEPLLQKPSNHHPDLTDLEKLPPKTNAIKKDDAPIDKDEKDDKSTDLNKNKDYLLVGSGNSANSVYLLHENQPNGVVPNGNQPTNNVIYIPYNPGQPSQPPTNQAYQIVNSQPLPSNQVSPDKSNVNNGGYTNGIINPGQSVINMNTPNESPNYVLVYSNGQVIKIPGVVINQQPNNVPLQNGNQGSNIIVANAVPNVQNVPMVQNPAQNVIYAAIPNQPTNGQIVVQMPSCMQNVPSVCSGSGAVLMNPVQGVISGQPNNIVYNQQPTNGYIQPNVPDQGQNVLVAVPNQPVFVNPNTPVQTTINDGSYIQPMVQPTNPVQNPNEVVNTPSPVLPNNNMDNGYTQPIVLNPGNQSTNTLVNTPSHDVVSNAPGNEPLVALPANAIPSGSAIVLDDTNLSSLGAQPAIMISSFKETKDDKDINNGDKKAENDENKKNDKKSNDKDKQNQQKKKDSHKKKSNKKKK